MKKEFKILSSSEERELSISELKEYYVKLREYLLESKLKVTTPGATTIAPKLKNITNKIAVSVTKMFTNKNVEWIYDGTENIPDGPVLFAHTHQGLLDGFVWIPTLDKHCILLHGEEENST